MSGGAYIRQFGSTGTGNSQLQEPRGVAFGAGNVALIADAGNRRLARWSGADLDPQSGVVSTEVKVDGTPVEPKYAPGCSTKNCSISREWTLHAKDYGSGQHKVEVTATDGVGLSTTKELTVTTDNTPPQLTATNNFFTAPEGWLEQKNYFYTPSASDTGGYGVTSLVLKIDGNIVNSKTQTCAGGGCSASLGGIINMSAYDGGSHPAELIATDAAGNVSKKTWTINVDPVGYVTTGEAEDTLEALDATSSVNTVGVSKEEEEFEGTAPGLGLEKVDGYIEATGTEVPTTIELDPAGPITLQVLDPELIGFCEVEEEEEEETACVDEAASETDEDAYPGLDPIMLTPVETASSATDNALAESSAAIAANTTQHVDTITRPLYDGGMVFQVIRDSAAPETYSWEVQLEPDQELVQINDQYAVVRYTDGIHVAFSIDARPAHDAIGTAVPAKISVSEGNIITLAVEHRASSPGGGKFVYPVVGGSGWQGGLITHYVAMPPPEIPQGPTEAELTFGGYEIFSAPEPADGEASISSATRSKNFIKVICSHFKAFDGENLSSLWEQDCGNPWRGDPGVSVAYRAAMRGRVFYDGNYVWHRGSATNGIDCAANAAHVDDPGDDGFGKQRRARVDRCVWWGHSPGGNGGQKQSKGHHISAFGQFTGEMRGWCGDDCGGTPNPWESFPIPSEGGLAFYLWPNGNREFHETDCIDC